MSDSNSSSSSTQTTNYSDNRKALGQGALDVSGGSSVNIVSNTTTSDPAVIGKALDTNLSVTNSALNFGSDALSFGGKALDTSSKAFTQSLDFADNTVGNAFKFGDAQVTKSLNASSDAFNSALGFAAGAESKAFNTASDAIGSASNAMAAALAFGGKQTATALDSLNTSANLINSAYADAKGRGALTDKILMVAIAGALFVAWHATKG